MRADQYHPGIRKDKAILEVEKIAWAREIASGYAKTWIEYIDMFGIVLEGWGIG